MPPRWQTTITWCKTCANTCNASWIANVPGYQRLRISRSKGCLPSIRIEEDLSLIAWAPEPLLFQQAERLLLRELIRSRFGQQCHRYCWIKRWSLLAWPMQNAKREDQPRQTPGTL